MAVSIFNAPLLLEELYRGGFNTNVFGILYFPLFIEECNGRDIIPKVLKASTHTTLYTLSTESFSQST